MLVGGELAALRGDEITLLTLAASLTRQFRFASTRNNSATVYSAIAPKTRAAQRQGGTELISLRESPGFFRLPKSWAKAGAFSLLPAASKLAQY
jgi:hypothetical protein